MTNTPFDPEFTARWVASQPMVTAYIASVVVDFHETEDVLQKVAAIAFVKRDQYDPERPFYAWVAGIARYELMRWRRDKARDRHVFTSETLERIERVSSEIHDELDARRSALGHCLERVTPKGRRFIEMRYSRGLTFKQIAQELGAKPVAIRVALHRVRTALHDCISNRLRSTDTSSEGASHE